MCLRIDNCFGFGAPRTDDDIGPPPSKPHAPPPTRAHPAQRTHYNGNGGGGGHYYNGNSYPAHAGAAEADRKASNDARKGPAPAHAVPTAVYPYAGADGALKQQPTAANGGVAQHSYYHYEPAHKEDAADSYYYPAATTATADHGRY